MLARWSATTKRWVVIAVIAAALVVLVAARDVVHPFVWAAIFAYVFTPVVNVVQRRTRLPRVAVGSALFAVLALALYSLGRVLVPIAADQFRDLQQRLPELLDNIRALALRSLEGTGFERVAISALDQADDVAQSVVDNIIPVALGIGAVLLKTLVFVIALWYLLLDGPRVGVTLRAVLPPGQRDELLRLFGRINSVLGQYVRGQVLLIAIMSTVTSIGLSVLGVPFSILLGLLTGILETLPIAGPIAAGTIAVLVALGHPNPFGLPQVGYAGIVAVMYTILRHAEDYFVIPLVIGRIVELHPLVVIFSLLVGGAVGGLLGLLLAVPVAASVRIALLYALAKLRDEDPFPVITEGVVASEERITGVSKRPA